jgi:hypothetical protein
MGEGLGGDENIQFHHISPSPNPLPPGEGQIFIGQYLFKDIRGTEYWLPKRGAKEGKDSLPPPKVRLQKQDRAWKANVS